MTGTSYPDITRDAPIDPLLQRRIGLVLAGSIIAAWLALHIGAVFFFPLSRPMSWPLSWATALLAAVLIALQTWLYVGLFIVAHDCMHGSLVPYKPWANRLIGGLCLALYGGFSFDGLNAAHHRHHRAPGTADDPDFDDHPPHGFWRWFGKFFAEYFSWREGGIIVAVYVIYVFVLGAAPLNALVFWAVPALLSALQLFTFGTFLPHRPDAVGFVDRHNARTNDFPVWLSLLTCFHFGYHHEHHLYPTLPWWRLPGVRGKT